MKRSTVVLTMTGLLLVAGATLVPAGDGQRGPKGMREHGPLGPLGRALHQLDLTDDQRAQVRTVLETARPDLQALRERLRTNREAFRESQSPTQVDEAAIRAHVAAQATIQADLAVAVARVRASVLALLTPGQLAELEQLRERGPTRGHGPRWDED